MYRDVRVRRLEDRCSGSCMREHSTECKVRGRVGTQTAMTEEAKVVVGVIAVDASAGVACINCEEISKKFIDPRYEAGDRQLRGRDVPCGVPTWSSCTKGAEFIGLEYIGAERRDYGCTKVV